MKTTAYRYSSEYFVLFLSLLIILVLSAVASVVSICLVPVIAIFLVLLSYWMSQSQHNQLVQHAQRVTAQETPQLAELVEQCVKRIKPDPVEVFVAGSRELNAYTFGLGSPKTVVLYSSLFKVMDADELRFIIGHELGHVALGHTWLNSLVGGLAGVPTSIGAAIVISLAFRGWNRTCEYSADRAGLLACGKPNKAISALVKLVNRNADTPEEVAATLQVLDQEDDRLDNILLESLATHPMMVKRIEELKKFAASGEYRQLQAMMG
jgi:Zn-dependent protease with chaperone function